MPLDQDGHLLIAMESVIDFEIGAQPRCSALYDQPQALHLSLKTRVAILIGLILSRWVLLAPLN